MDEGLMNAVLDRPVPIRSDGGRSGRAPTTYPPRLTGEMLRTLDACLRAGIAPQQAVAHLGYTGPMAITRSIATLQRQGLKWRRNADGVREVYLLHSGEPLFPSGQAAEVVVR